MVASPSTYNRLRSNRILVLLRVPCFINSNFYLTEKIFTTGEKHNESGSTN